MTFFRWRRAGLALLLLLAAVPSSFVHAQVSAEEITDRHLKALEARYLQDMIALNRDISARKYAFPFSLSRYVSVDLKNQARMDTRGLEFVNFHDRSILKVSAIYNAAFDSRQLTQNQRASQVFTEIVAPILGMLPQRFAGVNDFDGFGFEISYHVTQGKKGSEYEGKENLVVVMAVDDALHFSQVTAQDMQQKMLNRSEIYLSGERFGLAPGESVPIPADTLADSTPAPSRGTGEHTPLPDSPKSGRNQDLAFGKTTGNTGGTSPKGAEPDAPSLTPADVDAMQEKFQSALDQYGASVRGLMNQTGPIAPSLALFRNSPYLQITLKNPQVFDKDKTSLYKRAALSFDTFLAPHLGDLVSHLPPALNIAGLDITVLVATSTNSSSSEAMEYICPLHPLRSFAAYEISNQDLIDQSLVIVNGVRISLSLQQVE